jgi:hypothetical protein
VRALKSMLHPGISDKRKLSASFLGELAQSRSQSQVVSQVTASQSTSEKGKLASSFTQQPFTRGELEASCQDIKTDNDAVILQTPNHGSI